MAKQPKSNANEYSNQFKPAINLGAPGLEDWTRGFYALRLQEKVDGSGEHFLRLGRGVSDDPSLTSVVQLQTMVSGFSPNCRQVEVTGKKGYMALCFEGGANQLGVFVYLFRNAPLAGENSEFHINTRYLPYVMLTDLIVGTAKSGLVEIKLPEVDIAKLNVTLRLSDFKEPEYRTFKTEVIFENLSAQAQEEIENRLNFETASVIAFVGHQIFSSKSVTSLGSTPEAGLGINPSTKAFGVAVLVTAGAVINLVNNIVLRNPLGGIGAGLTGAGAIYLAWTRWNDIRRQENPPLLQNQQELELIV